MCHTLPTAHTGSPLRLLYLTTQSAFLWLYFTRHWEHFHTIKLALSCNPVGWVLLSLSAHPRIICFITGAWSQQQLPHQRHTKGGSWPGPFQVLQKPITAYCLELPKTWSGLPAWEFALCRFPPHLLLLHNYHSALACALRHIFNNILVVAANLRVQRNLLRASNTELLTLRFIKSYSSLLISKPVVLHFSTEGPEAFLVQEQGMGENNKALCIWQKAQACLLLTIFRLLGVLNLGTRFALEHLSQNNYSQITQHNEEELFKMPDTGLWFKMQYVFQGFFWVQSAVQESYVCSWMQHTQYMRMWAWPLLHKKLNSLS